MPKTPESDLVLAQFNLLIEEILGEGLRRSKFQPWEIEILLDIESCQIPESRIRAVLSEYRMVVQAELEKGAHVPLRFSAFLARQEPKNILRKPPKGSFRAPKIRKRMN